MRLFFDGPSYKKIQTAINHKVFLKAEAAHDEIPCGFINHSFSEGILKFPKHPGRF
jgi:hypothetical protein